MRSWILTLLISFITLSFTVSAQAQVRFDLYSNPYTGPSVNISVGQPQPGIFVPVVQQPYYYPTHPVPIRRGRHHRGYQAPVVVTSHWCAYHRVHCTHAPYARQAARQNCQPQYQTRTPYWCQPHREYCTHG